MHFYVKIRFTLSALSAMEYNFVMLSDLRVGSAIINRLTFWSESKGLKMKTYTLTWRQFGSWHKSGLCRCRFNKSSPLWYSSSDNPILAFVGILFLLDLSYFFGLDCGFDRLRLSSCGRLVARSATYRGV